MSKVVTGEDGATRCPWGTSTAEYKAYHDQEWGRPTADDLRVYEKLCLEGFQAGLSWLTILRKREGFRRAFAAFDPDVVARFGPAEIERLVQDPGIVRHRGKIMATIANARATVRLREQGVGLAALFWRYEADEAPGPRTESGAVPASTPEAKALSGELRREGYRYVGPTTVYSAMQALGVVNDHLEGCAFRSVCEGERAVFRVPR